MYALADCNNFFVSCERLFRPDLNGKAVVVLSNNDGCAISRSNEAKALGIAMGQPMFQFKHLVECGKVTVFSSNHTLYRDISSRIHSTLREEVPGIEVYSIDEAFLDLRGIPHEELAPLGHRLHRLCLKNVGIPVSVGISHTKTLAKIASKLCKRYPRLEGACVMERQADIEKVLRTMPAGDVWGIGRRISARLRMQGVATAYDYYCLEPQWVQRHLGLPGLRTWEELHGTSSIRFGQTEEGQKQICVSRSFAAEITDAEELFGQISVFVSMAAEKLRRQRSIASEIMVFIHTSRFKEASAAEFLNAVYDFETPTDDTLEIVAAARKAFVSAFRKGPGFKRAGVILSGITPKEGMQMSLFEQHDTEKSSRLMAAIDSINARQGRGSVSVASDDCRGIRMHRAHLSPQYTTKWSDIMTIDATVKI